MADMKPVKHFLRRGSVPEPVRKNLARLWAQSDDACWSLWCKKDLAAFYGIDCPTDTGYKFTFSLPLASGYADQPNYRLMLPEAVQPIFSALWDSCADCRCQLLSKQELDKEGYECGNWQGMLATFVFPLVRDVADEVL